MHSAVYNGYQFNYNGDYSGDIRVTDRSVEWMPMTFDHILHLVSTPDALAADHLPAFREFVAEAIRSQAISLWEQMEVDEILNSVTGRAVLSTTTEGTF